MSAREIVHGESEALKQLKSQLQTESSDGLKLVTCPDDNPICSIRLDESIPGIVVVWKRYATSTQLRFIHEHILSLLKKHGVGKILGDDTALPTIHNEDQAWIARTWMPRAIAAGFRAGASKSPSSHFGRLSVDGVRSEVPGSLTIRVFDRLADARQWLQEFEF